MPTILDGNAVIPLFVARITTGNGEAFNWPGGEGLLEIDGTWGGTSFKLQRSRDGETGTFRDLDSSVTFAANGCTIIALPPGWVRGVLTGGAAMSINAALQRIPS